MHEDNRMDTDTQEKPTPSIWPVVAYGLAMLLGFVMVYRVFNGLPVWPFALAAGAALLLGKLTS